MLNIKEVQITSIMKCTIHLLEFKIFKLILSVGEDVENWNS